MRLGAGTACLWLTSSALAAWVPIGPAPAINGQIENVSPDNQVAGAVHVVAAHPTNPDILYVGGVNGGIWKTTNATASSPTWTPLTDAYPASMSALEFDPTDATHETLVAANGGVSSFGRFGPLRGLLRTTDGGTTWTPIAHGAIDGRNVTGLAARGATLVVTAAPGWLSVSSGGVFRSGDTGATWTQLDGFGSGLAASAGGYTDLVGDAGNLDRLYTVNARDAIYRSDDGGVTWVDISSGDAALDREVSDVDAENIEMAVGPTGRLWVVVHVYGRSTYIGHADDPGSASPTWVRMDLPFLPGESRRLGAASNTTPIVVSTATGLVTDASNTTPIVITSPGHGLIAGATVLVEGVTGNLGANGAWSIYVLGADRFGLSGSVGSGAYGGGGTWREHHGLFGPGDTVRVAGVTGNAAANGVFRVTLIDDFSFQLRDSAGSGPYTGGGTWQVLDSLNPARPPGGQGGVHSSIVADPTDADLVYCGGDTQVFPTLIGATEYTGRLFRGDASVPGTGAVPSPQWEHLTHISVPEIPGGGTASASAPHADSREMIFDASGRLIEVSDGGVYVRTSPRTNTGDWFSLNSSLQITEFHDMAYDTLSNVVLGGTQDNGTLQQPAEGALVWTLVYGGDGGDVAVDASSVPGRSIRYFSSQYLYGFSRESYAADGTLIGYTEVGLEITDGSIPLTRFITPFELNIVDPTRLVIGAGNHVYESFDRGDTLITVDPFDPATPRIGIGANWDALAYGGYRLGVPNADVLYFGSGHEVYVRTTPAPDAPVATGFPGGLVRDIVLASNDWETAYVLDDFAVWSTADAGATWVDVTGDLAPLSLRLDRIEFMPGTSDRVLVSGIFDGVPQVRFMTTDAPGTWSELAPGLPSGLVGELDYDATDRVLVAGTLGRGAWKYALPCSAGDESLWYRDVDLDGHGDASVSVSACSAPDGYVADGDDNCVGDANAGQENSDADPRGDACDNCPSETNPDQADLDGDDLGDLCDPDDDGDGIPDASDRCPVVADPEATDFDGDGIPDACDNCPSRANAPDEDTNGDGVVNHRDAQANRDGDAFGDVCDRCPFRFNDRNTDGDGDGLGDECDPFLSCPLGCFLLLEPNGPGALGGGLCLGCPGGLPRPGRVVDCLDGFGSEACVFGLAQPTSPNICPPELQILDLCCTGGNCPGGGFRLSAPQSVGTLDLDAVELNLSPDAAFGPSSAFAPDLNGLNFPEIAVSAPLAGQVHLVSPETGTIHQTIPGDASGFFGWALARHPLGLAVGAPHTAVGRVILLDPGGQQVLLDRSGVTPGGRFGWAISSFEDLDGDAIDDLIVGAPGDGSGIEGKVFTVLSGPNPLGPVFSGAVASERFGFAVDACDLDGDGDADLVVGAPDAIGPGNTRVGRVDAFDRAGGRFLSLLGTEPQGGFGSALSCGEDADGDEIPDLLVGAPLASSNAAGEGRAFLFNGRGELLARWSGLPGDHLGRTLTLASGQNGDARGDVVVSDAFGGDGRGTSKLYLSDGDADQDGLDLLADNCPGVSNPNQDDQDGDGAGDACDSCPAVADPSLSDADGDLRGDRCDNCPLHANPGQGDGDLDGHGDLCDCFPTSPTTWAKPAIVQGLRAAKSALGPNHLDLTWGGLASQAGPSTFYQVVSGDLALLRTPAAFTDALCVHAGTPQTEATVFRLAPQPGQGFWYLVRGRNACGNGSWNSGGPRQVGSRDPAVAQSSQLCVGG